MPIQNSRYSKKNGPLGIPVKHYNKPIATGRQNVTLRAITEVSNESNSNSSRKSRRSSKSSSKSSHKTNNSDVIRLRRTRSADIINIPLSNTRRLFPKGYNPIKGFRKFTRKIYDRLRRTQSR